MSFLKYKIPEQPVVMIGDNGNQIRESLFDWGRRYKTSPTMPPNSSFEIKELFVLSFHSFLFVRDGENLEPIKLLDDLEIRIRAPMFQYVKSIANWGDSNRKQQYRGGLYRIDPVICPSFVDPDVLYVSPRIIETIQNHNWEQYQGKVDEILKRRDVALTKLALTGAVVIRKKDN